jgi:putative nucleotidyltransferase with HDIG domain
MRNLLVIDDEEAVREALYWSLAGEGYNITLTQNGQEGLKCVQKEEFDLVLTDLRMPKMGGLEFLKALKRRAPYTSVIIITGYGDMESAIEAMRLGASDYITKPFTPEEVRWRVNEILEDHWREQERYIKKLLIDLGNVIKKLEETEDEHGLQKNFVEIIQKVLHALLDIKDGYTGGHCQRVAKLSLMIAQALGLPKESEEILRETALLHDIGKLNIKKEILLKLSPLTNEEFTEVKKHTVLGKAFMKAINFLQQGIPTLLAHHEHYNGQGYPKGLKGEEIPLLSRIIAVADAFDAMVTERPYRKRLSRKEAIQEIERGAGKQFCPKVVSAFLKVMK